MHTRAKGS